MKKERVGELETEKRGSHQELERVKQRKTSEVDKGRTQAEKERADEGRTQAKRDDK